MSTELRIAFCVAALDEAASIDACVASLRNQDYPTGSIAVCVADGGSMDGTQAIVRRHSAEDPRVSLVANPARIAAGGFNAGIRSADADIYCIVSAHSCVAPDYARSLSSAFARSGAMLVGGRMRACPPETPMGSAIAWVTSSPVGVGGARFHYSEEPGWVDTAFPGAYRRELLDEIGLFDEALVRNQDDDLHFRAARAGHRMWYEPGLITDYVPRSTLRGVWRQYFEYGFWRARTLAKHRAVASWRHLVPSVFVAGLVGGPVVAARRAGLRRLYAAGLLSYSAALALAGARSANPVGVRLRVPVAAATIHLAYGSGFWTGLLSMLRRPAR